MRSGRAVTTVFIAPKMPQPWTALSGLLGLIKWRLKPVKRMIIKIKRS